MENKKITLRSAYKTKEYHFQPLKMANGMNYPFVKKVRTNSDGSTEMILSEKELNDPESEYFIPEDLDIVVTDGFIFDLSNPLERNKWASIEHSELIVPSRNAKDEFGNLIIDGDKQRYGLAELWIDIPGEESEKSVSKKKLITKAWNYIEQDSIEGCATKVKLLGKSMRNAPPSDIRDYLYTIGEKTPNIIIDLYTSADNVLKLLLIDAKDKNIIRKVSGLYMYADNSLGATDESMILSLKDPKNIRLYESIKNETYPDFVRKIQDEAKSIIAAKQEKIEEDKKNVLNDNNSEIKKILNIQETEDAKPQSKRLVKKIKK